MVSPDDVKHVFNVCRNLLRRRWRFIIHFILVVAVTAQVSIFSMRHSFQMGISYMLTHSLMPEGFDDIEASREGYITGYITTIDDVLADIERTVVNFYALEDTAAETLLLLRNFSQYQLNSAGKIDDIDFFSTDMTDPALRVLLSQPETKSIRRQQHSSLALKTANGRKLTSMTPSERRQRRLHLEKIKRRQKKASNRRRYRLRMRRRPVITIRNAKASAEADTLSNAALSANGIEELLISAQNSLKNDSSAPMVMKVVLSAESERSYLNGSKPLANHFKKLPDSFHMQYMTKEQPLGFFTGMRGNKVLLRSLFDRMVSIQLQMAVTSLETSRERDLPECVAWVMTKTYRQVGSGAIPVVFKKYYTGCPNVKDFEISDHFRYEFLPWLCILVIILAIASSIANVMILFLKYKASEHLFVDTWRQLPWIPPMFSAKHTSETKRHSWKQRLGAIFTNLRQFIRLFSLWTVITIVSDIFNIIASFVMIREGSFTETHFDALQVPLAIGSLAVWVNLVGYFRRLAKFNILVLALKGGLGQSIRLLIGSLPIYLGFTIAGTALFSHYSPFFSTFDQSSSILYSVMNGDSILATFLDVQGNSLLLTNLGRLFIFVFVVIFDYAGSKIFIFIFQDAYVEARENQHRIDAEMHRKREEEQLRKQKASQEYLRQYSELQLRAVRNSSLVEVVNSAKTDTAAQQSSAVTAASAITSLGAGMAAVAQFATTGRLTPRQTAAATAAETAPVQSEASTNDVRTFEREAQVSDIAEQAEQLSQAMQLTEAQREAMQQIRSALADLKAEKPQ